VGDRHRDERRLGEPCDGEIVGTVRGSADASNVGVERTREGYVRIDRVADFVDTHVVAWK
jgi:hypothetical protein